MSDNNKIAVSAEQTKKYYDSVHFWGRIGSIVAVLFMVGIPLFIGVAFDAMPSMTVLVTAGSGLLALFLPISISEVFSYAPVLGSASYITFITGEIMNIKVPCALNATKVSGYGQGTPENDAIVTLAISICSLFAMLAMLLGIFLFIPLQPVLELPVVQIATANMIPALFGCLALGVFSSKSGKYTVKNRLLPVIPVLIITILLLIFAPMLVAYFQGILILLMLPVVIGVSRLLYKKKIIRVYEEGNPNPMD